MGTSSRSGAGRRGLVALALAAAAVAGGSYYATRPDAAPSAPPPPAPTRVVVQTLTPQPVQVWSEFSGRLQAVDAAEIRPEVSGRITEVRFEDGQTVKAGDILFVIDPRPYEAAMARAEAALASARTTAGYTKVEFDRAASMVQTQAVPQRVFDERGNASRVAVASVRSAEAALKQAALDLEHAYVRAPIAGRAGRVEITLGNLVQAGPGAPLLTRVVSSAAIYADFEVDEQTYVQTARAHAGLDGERRVPVELVVPGDARATRRGTIYAFDNRLDAASGTIRARAKFDNADGVLVPGMFVTVRLAAATEPEAILVPDRALGFDQSKRYVYVVGADNKVGYREVELGRQVQAQRIVLKGVAAGERVIVSGLQHVRPAATVDPQEAGADGRTARP